MTTQHKILTLEEASLLPSFHQYAKGVYKYKDEYWHLIKDGKDLLAGLKAVNCLLYGNGFFQCKDENGDWYSINTNITQTIK